MLPNHYHTNARKAAHSPAHRSPLKAAAALCLAAILAAADASAQKPTTFTPAEQQQVSIATPGLFDKSDAFAVDFAGLKDREYSFPLPVGKAEAAKDNYFEIDTKPGDAVKAMFDGEVRLSRHSQSHGNVIVIRHDNGLETMYALNAQNLVSVGDRVHAGQTIAIVGGADGRTYCLAAIMVNGGRVNPETVISLRRHSLRRHTLLFKQKGDYVSLKVLHRDEADEPSSVQTAEAAPRKPFADSDRLEIRLADIPSSDWAYPLPGAKVISPYGRRSRRPHSGVDIKTCAGDEIHAAFDGVVTMAQPYSAYGNLIRIQHYNGLETYYSHNQKNLVSVGDHVRAGQVIALTGRTGRATTEHLHFEVRVAGQTIDPSRIFNHSTHSLRTETITFTKKGSRVYVGVK